MTPDPRCLDVLLVNQTANTLQNLCLDFATLGDLKLVERPAVYTIAPHGFQSIKATIKVRTHNASLVIHAHVSLLGLVNGDWRYLWQYPVGRPCAL